MKRKGGRGKKRTLATDEMTQETPRSFENQVELLLNMVRRLKKVPDSELRERVTGLLQPIVIEDEEPSVYKFAEKIVIEIPDDDTSEVSAPLEIQKQEPPAMFLPPANTAAEDVQDQELLSTSSKTLIKGLQEQLPSSSFQRNQTVDQIRPLEKKSPTKSIVNVKVTKTNITEDGTDEENEVEEEKEKEKEGEVEKDKEKEKLTKSSDVATKRKHPPSKEIEEEQQLPPLKKRRGRPTSKEAMGRNFGVILKEWESKVVAPEGIVLTAAHDLSRVNYNEYQKEDFVAQLNTYSTLWRKSRNLTIRLAFAYGALFEALFVNAKKLNMKWKVVLKTYVPFGKSQANDFRRLHRELGSYKRLLYLDCTLKALVESCTGIVDYFRTHPTVAQFWQSEPENLLANAPQNQPKIAQE